MVQYIVTPWRDRAELFRVRSQLFPDRIQGAEVHQCRQEDCDQQQEQVEDRDRRRDAVNRIHMWGFRGRLPHLIEATGQLVAVRLMDEEESRRRKRLGEEAGGGGGPEPVSDMVVQLAYSAAFGR